MVARSYIKSVVRSVKSSLSRFFAIFMIVALGVGFLAGLLSATPDMRNSVDTYYKQTRFMDIRVAGNLGMCIEDADAIAALPGVAGVMPAMSLDFFVSGAGGEEVVARVQSMRFDDPDGNDPNVVNRLVLEEGRWPSAKNECVMEKQSAFSGHFPVGGTITMTDANKDLDDQLNTTEYVITGIVSSSAYLNLSQRGYTTLGTGQLSAILYVAPDCFATDYYTDLYVSLSDSAAYGAFTQQYLDMADKAAADIEALGETQKYVRRDSIRDDATRELEDAKQTLEEKTLEADEKLLEVRKEIDDGEKELNDALRELEKGEQEYRDGVKKLADGRAEFAQKTADAQREIDEGRIELDDARVELEDGWAQLLDGEKKLEDARAELEDGKRQLDEGEQKYADGLAEIEENQNTINDGMAQIRAGKRQIAENEQKLRDGQKQLDAAMAQIADGERQLAEGEALLNDSARQLEIAKAALPALKQALEQAKDNREYVQTLLDNMPSVDDSLAAMEAEAARISAKPEAERTQGEIAFLSAYDQLLANTTEEQRRQWQDLMNQYSDAEELITELEVQISALETTIADGERQLADGRAELEANRKKLADGRAEAEASQKVITNGWVMLREGENELLDAEQQLKDGQKKLDEGRKELEDALPELEQARLDYQDGLNKYLDGVREVQENRLKLEDGQKEYEQGLIDIDDAVRQLADGKVTAEREFHDAEVTLADGRIELDDGWMKYADGKKELEDGKKEYEKGVIEADEKLQEAWDEITAAEDKLRDMEAPKWYVLTREANAGYVTYSGDSDKIESIARVFPIFFFLVATLVASTTMTRMVEEERTNIGTMKALGYGNGAIAAKFTFYAGVAAIMGSAAGLAVGLKLFPGIIYGAYGMMYNLPPMNASGHLIYGTLSTAAIFIGIMFATLGALRSSLGENAASLMRPKAPKEGKRIFLERITPLWKRLKFTSKVTARNLIRYKKRFFMTVVGIFGCTALLLCGFGLRDSISDIVALQFGSLFEYNLSVAIKHTGDDTKDSRISRVMANTGRVERYIAVHQENATLTAGKNSCTLTITSPASAGDLTGYIKLRDRVSGDDIAFDDDSVLLSEKAAKMLGVKAGDTVSVENQDGEIADFTLTGIVENYVQGYIYIPQKLYTQAFDSECSMTVLLARADDASEEIRDKAAEDLLRSPNVTSVSFTAAISETFDEMLETIDYIVVVLIISAGLLAFIVMYNLTNINITERQKELATIKVLGFYPMEVAMYIFRETMILSLVGAAVGLVGGVFLHQFVIQTAEVDNMMFGRVISPVSFVMSLMLTMMFSLIVNLIMSGKLKKISMADSLKAPE